MNAGDIKNQRPYRLSLAAAATGKQVVGALPASYVSVMKGLTI